jgi:UDP-N-acetylglucosamine/UDP-N-acetylgalactosamine diphosphorylase
MTMKEQLLDSLAPFGQEHLLAFWQSLVEDQRQSLARQIGRIDMNLVTRLYRSKDNQSDYRAMADRAESPPAFRLDASANKFAPRQAKQCGREALAAGRIGAILVAGGQGTRLGFPKPKGLFSIGPISGKTLFQIHVEKLLALGRRHGVRIPLYLMTSPATHRETLDFFAQNNRFGLAEEDLVVFCQGTMPAVDISTGRILMERPDRIAVSPDGHGGMLAAISGGGALDNILSRGIEHLFYFQVDNPLVDVCAAEFLGYHILDDSEITTQVVAKQDPFERVGNVVKVDGRLMVIEYSDLPDDVAQRRNADGSLAIWAGSIAVHAIGAAFLKRAAGMADALPFHIARKKVACIDAAGRLVEPREPNAVKFERFIFDLIPAAGHSTVVEIDPDEGFAPLKNGPGAPRDTAVWVQQQMTAQHRRWLRSAGAIVDDDVPVEISPTFALDEEELAAKVRPGIKVTKATYWND